VYDLEPHDHDKGNLKAHLRKTYWPIVMTLVAPYRVTSSETWTTDLVDDLAYRALGEREQLNDPEAQRRTYLPRDVAAAATSPMSDYDLSVLILAPDGLTFSPSLLAVAQEHRPGFTWQPPRDSGALMRDIAGLFGRTG
jgi:hypothetical protein